MYNSTEIYIMSSHEPMISFHNHETTANPCACMPQPPLGYFKVHSRAVSFRPREMLSVAAASPGIQFGEENKTDKEGDVLKAPPAQRNEVLGVK